MFTYDPNKVNKDILSQLDRGLQLEPNTQPTIDENTTLKDISNMHINEVPEAIMTEAPQQTISQWEKIKQQLPQNEFLQKSILQDYVQNISNNENDLEYLPEYFQQKYEGKTENEILNDIIGQQIENTIIQPLQEKGLLPKEGERYLESIRQGFGQNEIIASHLMSDEEKQFTPKGIGENIGYALGMGGGLLLDLLPINKALQIAGLSAKIYQGTNFLSKTAGPTLGNMIEQGLGFSIQSQLTDKEHKNRAIEATKDFLVGALFPLIGKGSKLAEATAEKTIGKGIISKATSPATVAGIFYGLGKLQGLDDASALGQAIAFGAMHTLEMIPDKQAKQDYEQSLIDRLFDGDRQAFTQAIDTYAKSKSAVKYYFNLLKEFKNTDEFQQIKKELSMPTNKLYASLPGIPQIAHIIEKTPKIFELFNKGIAKIDKDKLNEEKMINYLETLRDNIKVIDKDEANNLDKLIQTYKLDKQYRNKDLNSMIEEWKQLKDKPPFEDNIDTKKQLLEHYIMEKLPKLKTELFDTAYSLYESYKKIKNNFKIIKGTNAKETSFNNTALEKEIKKDPFLSNIYDKIEANSRGEKIKKFLNLKKDKFIDLTIDVLSQDNPEIEIFKENEKNKKVFNSILNNIKEKKIEDKKLTEVKQIITEIATEKDKKKLTQILGKYKRKTAIKGEPAKLLKLIKNQPTAKQIDTIINKYGYKLVEKALNDAIDKNVISTEKAKLIEDAIQKAKKALPTYINPKGKGLTKEQKFALLDMNSYKDLFKEGREKKVNIDKLNKAIKKNNLQLELVEPQRDTQHYVPFKLLGNKQHTFKEHLLPLYIQAIKNGKTIFNEPFGGAGLSIAYFDDLFNAGLEHANINIYDLEKYLIIKYLHEHGFDEKIDNMIKETKDEIIQDLETTIRKEIPEIGKYLDQIDAKFGTKQFVKEAREIAMLYPKLAKDFFRENPDAKLAKEGKITSTFIDWIKEKIQKKLEKKDYFKKLSDKEKEKLIEQETDKFLQQEFIEKYYPKLTKALEKTLDKYEKYNELNNKLTDDNLKKALQTAISRKYRFAKSDSGQGIFETTKGFKNLENKSRERFYDGLKHYGQQLEKYKDKVSLYNMDGAEFIRKITKETPPEKAFFYLDPPYLRTTHAYIKNQKNKEAMKLLNQYATPDNFKKVIEPLKNYTTILTNDINGDYFNILKETFGDRLNDRILGYVEGVTPTSLVTTKDLHLNTDHFMPYLFLKKLKKPLSPIQQKENEIAKGLSRTFQKILKEVAKGNEQLYNKLLKINEGIELAQQEYEEILDKIDEQATWKEARQLISKVRKEVNKGKITGKDFTRLIREIEKHFKLREELTNKIKKIEKKINNKSFDAELREDIKENILSNIDTTKPKSLKTYKLIKEYIEDGQRTEEHIKAYERYIQQLEKGRNPLNNIYLKTPKELEEIINTLETAIEKGNKWKKYREEEKEKINNELEKIEITIPEVDSRSISEMKNLRTKLKYTPQEAKKLIIKSELYTTPIEYIMEDIGLKPLYDKYIVNPIRQYRMDMFDYNDKILEIAKDLSLEDSRKISIYGLLHRGDGLGIIKVKSYLLKEGDPLNNQYKPKTNIEKRADEKISERIKQGENFLSKKQLNAYNKFRNILDTLYEKQKKSYYETENKILPNMENYRPIVLDYQKNKDLPNEVKEWEDTALITSLKKGKIDSSRVKKATSTETIPSLNALLNMRAVGEEILYHYNLAKNYKKWKMIVNSDKVKNTFKYTPYRNWIEKVTERFPTKGKIKYDNKFGKRIEKILNKYQVATLGFNPIVMALQVSSLGDALIAGASTSVLYDFAKVITSPSLRKKILSKSKVIKAREGFDPIMATDQYIDSISNKFKKISFAGMIGLDKLTAMGIRNHIYDREIAKGTPEQEAIKIADNFTEKVMTNPHLEGIPQYIVEGRGAMKAFTMFQTFLANRLALWKRALRDPIKKRYFLRLARNILLMYTVMWLEKHTRELINETIFGYKPKNKDLTPSDIIGYFPIASSLLSNSKYGLEGPFKDIIDIIDSNKKNKTPAIIGGIGYSLGIPGTSTLKKLFYKKKKKNGGLKTPNLKPLKLKSINLKPLR